MNPSILPLLVIEMRELGIKSLALELSENPGSPPNATIERDTLAPGESHEPESPKDPRLCVQAGCTSEAGGIMGGAVARQYCREHALLKAGVRT